MRSLVAILLVLSLISLAASAEPTPDAASMRYEVPIGRTAHSPLVVPELGYVFGAHPYQSVIVGRIESAGLDTPDGTLGVVLRDFVLDGDGDCGPYPQSQRTDREKYPDGPPGINVKSLGLRVEGVTIQNVAGTALICNKTAQPDKRWSEPGSGSELRISNVRIDHCYDGLDVHTADSLISNVVVGGVRGVGIQPGSSATVEGCHVYGMAEGIHLTQPCYLIGNVTESGGYGVVNEGPGTQIVGHRAFWCNRVGIDLRAWAMVTNAFVSATKPESVAVRIGPGEQAHHAIVDVALELGGKSTGVIVSADKTDLTIRRSWGGKRTVVIDQPVIGCRLDVCVDGSEVGVEIQQLGQGNQIDITARQCKTPVVLPPGGVHRSNVITVNGKPYPGK